MVNAVISGFYTNVAFFNGWNWKGCLKFGEKNFVKNPENVQKTYSSLKLLLFQSFYSTEAPLTCRKPCVEFFGLSIHSFLCLCSSNHCQEFFRANLRVRRSQKRIQVRELRPRRELRLTNSDSSNSFRHFWLR